MQDISILEAVLIMVVCVSMSRSSTTSSPPSRWSGCVPSPPSCGCVGYMMMIELLSDCSAEIDYDDDDGDDGNRAPRSLSILTPDPTFHSSHVCLPICRIRARSSAWTTSATTPSPSVWPRSIVSSTRSPSIRPR